MDLPALIPLKNVILSYMNERGDYNLDNYKQSYQIVLEGYADLNIHHTTSFKTAYEVVNSVGIVKLPADYIDYIRIGLIQKGQFWTLSVNNNIKFSEVGSCYISVTDPELLVSIQPNYPQNYATGGGANVGEYRINATDRTIIFRGDMVGETICIEYISPGIGMSEETFVPRELMPVLKDYLDWVLKKRDDKMPEVKIMRAERQYGNSLAKYLRLKLTPTMDEVLDAIRSGYSQMAKR